MKLSQKGPFWPMFRRSLLLGVLASQVLLLPASAEEPVNVTDAQGCQKIEAKSARLLCYDTVADGGVFNQQDLEQVQKDSFGSKTSEPEVSVDEVMVTIVKVHKVGRQLHYFYTEDGAVWKQTNGSSWKLKAPFEARIKSGIMSSFFLVAEGGKSTRVKRVR